MAVMLGEWLLFSPNKLHSWLVFGSAGPGGWTPITPGVPNIILRWANGCSLASANRLTLAGPALAADGKGVSQEDSLIQNYY